MGERQIHEVTTESDIERACLALAKAKGGRMPKWVSPGYSGVPDRILLLPNLPPVFVEFKKPGGILSPLQRRWRTWLLSNGSEHWTVSNVNDFNRRIEDYAEPNTGGPA